jgi:2-octaprenyl-6-methoxyphenol hydroxylase
MKNNFHIAIIGAGLNGATAALAFANAGLDVAIIDKFDVNYLASDEFDGRTSAISFGSKQFYVDLGIWNDVVAEAGEIRDINILDSDLQKGDSFLKLHFNHADAKIEGIPHSEPMGWIVENRFLRKVLLDEMRKHSNIKIISPDENLGYKNQGNFAEIELKNAGKIQAKLVVLADGKTSNFAENLGLTKTFSDYNQKAIVFGVEHSKPHNYCATERFMPAGPFAILPLKSQNKSGVVWSDDKHAVDLFLKLPEAEFNAEVSKRFGSHLGEFTITTKIFSYPLYLNFTTQHTLPRVALIGDSAHGIHPIAGQGYNQGVKDTRDLAKIIKKYFDLGLDIGSEAILAEYQKARLVDNLQMVGATDFFVRFFSNNSKAIKAARRVGIAAVDKMPKVKAFFIKKAMG